MRNVRGLGLFEPRWFSKRDILARQCRLIFPVLVTLCAGNLGSQVAKAQNYLTAGGSPTFSAPAPIELGFTDTANGNLHLEISAGSFPQRGSKQPLTAKLMYDSSPLWTVSCGLSCSWQPNSFTIPGAWRLSVSGGLSALGGPGNCMATWMDAAGTTRSFTFSGTDPVTGQTCTGNGYATDSSGYKLLYNIGAVYAPDGTMAGHYGVSQSVPYNTNANAEDANGNYLIGPPQFSYPVVDTVGRSVANIQDGLGRSCSLGLTTCYIYVPNSQGGTSTYTATSASINVKTNFGQSGVTEYTGTLNVVPSITLPDGSSYTFKYDCDSSTGAACGSPSGQNAYYGLLVSLTLPTGGTINYTYENFKDSYGNFTRWLNGKWISGAGSWSFFPQVLSTCSSGQVGCQQQVTLTKPNNAYTVTTFTLNNGAWPVKILSYDGSGNLLSTVTNTFDFSNSCPFQNCHGAAYIRLLTQQTTVPVPGSAGNLTKQTQYTYDSPQTGNITAVKEWKYQPGSSPTFSATADRATYTSYFTTGTNNINRPLSVTVCNNSGSDSACLGGGSRITQMLYTYDSYSSCASGLVSVTGVSHHDDTNFGSGNTQRGNPTQIQSWVSGSTYLSTQICYDTTGQVLKAVDPAGNPTSYSYADSFFNETGASSMSSYTPPSPSNAYPTTVTRGGLTWTLGYYYGSGRPSISSDPNNVSTYHYYSDPFDRQTQTNFPIGWALTSYTSASQADIYTPVGDVSASSSCTSCQHNQVNLDTLGRKVNQKLVNAPGGAINVDTTYDSAGRVQSVSHAYVNPSDPSHVFETFVYDGANRSTSVTHPDSQSFHAFYGPLVTGFGAGGLSSQQGSPATYGYGYPTLSVDEVGKQKQEWSDGFGRIIEVDEPVTAQTPGIGSVSISGSERSKQIHCPLRCITLYDSGTLYITVNGHSDSASYGDGDDSASVASYLVSAINGDSGAPVSATLNGTTIDLTSKTTGSSTNYSLATSYQNTSGGLFTGTSFTPTPSGGSLAGGSNTGSSLATPTVTLYVYDAGDRLTQVVQGVQTRTFTYDGLGRRTSMTTPEAGTDNFYFTKSDNVSLCAGSASGVCRKTDARGITTTYTYDSLSRLTGKTYSNGQGAVTYLYDQGGAAAFALGRLTSIADPSGSETFTYNQGGRVTQKQKVIGTTTYPINYQYNAGGQVTQITYPSGRVVQQNVDNVGLLNTIVSGTTTYASIPEPPTGYNAAGQLLTFAYGNGVAANFSYSAARQQMTGLSYLKGSTTLFSLNYYYQQDSTNCTGGTTSNDDLIECIADNSGVQEAGRSVAYTYDALGRLNSAVTNGSSSYAAWGISESFDRYGNRLSQSVTAGTAPSNSLSFGTTPAPPANPPGGAYTNRPDGYSFDASGNMLNDGSNTLSYDDENCLITSTNASTGTSTYTCDTHGVRVKKALQGSTTTAYVFSGGMDIAEYDNGAAVNSPSREYIYLAGRLIATVQSTSTIYHHADHLSVRVTTDANGIKIGEQGHYPYGETWYASNTTTKFIFTSYERDAESGNDYAMARFYINRFGRFSCVDPLLGRPSDPQTWNRYAYVRNNPTNNVDPSGMGFLSFLVNFFKILLSIFTGGNWSLPGAGTPPIFSDPLGNTQATLNSIYHPIDPSKFMIDNFQAAQQPASVDLSALGPCLWAHFRVDLMSFTPARPAVGDSHVGTNGSFEGTMAGVYQGNRKPLGQGPSQFTVTTYDNGPANEIAADFVLAGGKMGPGTGITSIEAFTDPKDPFVNRVASDLSPEETVNAQIFELGNSLGWITGRNLPPPGRWRTAPGPGNNEPGGLLLDCYQASVAMR